MIPFPPERLEALKARQVKMLAAIRALDLPELQRLSNEGDPPEFARNATYRVVTYGAPAGPLLPDVLTPDAIIAGYERWMQTFRVAEFVGLYHGKEPLGGNFVDVFHLPDGTRGIIGPGDVLAFERVLDA